MKAPWGHKWSGSADVVILVLKIRSDGVFIVDLTDAYLSISVHLNS